MLVDELLKDCFITWKIKSVYFSLIYTTISLESSERSLSKAKQVAMAMIKAAVNGELRRLRAIKI